jgi:hypothetical protein
MTDTHTHIYICLSLGHLSGYLYLTLQVFKRYVGIALNHQLHMHSNSSKNRYTNIFVHIIYIYIYCMLMYLCIYIYIYCMLMYLCIWQCLSISYLSRCSARWQTGTDRCRLQPFGMQHAIGSIVAVSLAQLSSQQVLQISHCQRASLGTESSQPPFLSGTCGQG